MAIIYHEPLDRTFHALGDGTRRQIVALLATQGSCSASELQKPFAVAQPTISKHLKVLESAGLVKREIDGRVHRFCLETGPLNDASGWIERHKAFWEATLSRLDDFVTTLEAPEDNT
ncbi:metalloregulator ArsR/SmtB family transcription factor [uncultured Roseobacter sp.]|uniref:ArsR/SmtB family transcription factor n=1 Tax=uncultured Roseobacter sp. TaxID=114847 RepID=UPI002605667E|nr:metalloregulator ArsR/SmtB family transcription factor [uncultured Roseobacter sp.]